VINGDGDISFAEVAGEWEKVIGDCGSARCVLYADGKGLFPFCVRAGWLSPKGGGRIRCHLVYLILGEAFPLLSPQSVDERVDEGREVVAGWEDI